MHYYDRLQLIPGLSVPTTSPVFFTRVYPMVPIGHRYQVA